MSTLPLASNFQFPISNFGTAPASLSSTAAGGDLSLDQDEFLKLLLTQLQMQDPYQTMDQGAFMQQLATLANVQQITTLRQTLEDLTRGNALAQASALLGHQVEAFVNNQLLQGQVESIVLQDGQPYLLVKDQAVSLAEVQKIQ
jgi:flagellar basal-body rod modification protein FlgD